MTLAREKKVNMIKANMAKKGGRSKKGADIDRRGDDSSTDYRSGGSFAGGFGRWYRGYW